MPTIVRLTDSVKICIYGGPTEHNPPHFHVLTGDGKAFCVRIDNLQILKGVADRKAFAMAVTWAEANRETLLRRWRDLNG